jgi:hypothetical protein
MAKHYRQPDTEAQKELLTTVSLRAVVPLWQLFQLVRVRNSLFIYTLIIINIFGNQKLRN